MNSIGFGTWAWGNQIIWGYNPEKDDVLLEATFKEAIDGGINLIDTADSYGTGSLKGRSEELLGKFLKRLSHSKLKKITVATKLAPFPWRIGRKGFNNAFLLSKKRLQGKLDRVQIHWSTYRYAPWQETQLIDGLADLIEEGSVKEIGVSNMGPNRIRYFHQRLMEREIKLKSAQIQLSLLSPKPKEYQSLKDTCDELNIEVLAYSPLAFGVLTMKPEEEKLPSQFIRRKIMIRLLNSSKELRRMLNNIASYRRVSRTQVALNWVRSNGAIPIPGIRNPNQAREVKLAKNWDLSKKETDDLNILSLNCLERMPNNPFQSP